MTDPSRIRVAGPRPYEVVIGRGLLGELPGMLGERPQRVAVIHPGTLTTTAEAIKDYLSGTCQVITIEVPDAEDAKTAAVLEFCWNALGASGFTRSDAIVTVGGGATTDLGGFVAATWLRGWPWCTSPPRCWATCGPSGPACWRSARPTTIRSHVGA
jgi:3-dehydroquinate synthase